MLEMDINMLGTETLTLVIVSITAAAAAVITYWALFRVTKRTKPSLGTHPNSGNPVFLFDSDYLVDASPEAARLVASRQSGQSEKEALFKFLRPYFPTLDEGIETLETASHVRLLAVNDPDTYVDIEFVDGITKFALCSLSAFSAAHHYDALVRTAQDSENKLLQNITNNTPQLIWREDKTGQLAWANRSYLEASDQFGIIPEVIGSTWPKDPIFTGLAVPNDTDMKPLTTRASVTLPDEAIEHWFEITSVAVSDGVLRYATNVDDAIHAENTKRAFMQTLAKTFADLSVGLATFDNRRRLTIFNPAMHDVLGLPIDFLSSRPTLEDVLDRLRDLRKIPEPRNYKSWREQFMALEAEAVKGTYCEAWDLPEGQTLRVTGRPHPDGGIALLFEDISTEVSLTRKFRSEIETSQAVIDSFPDAIAVFSRAKTMVMMNKAYQDMWRIDETSLDANYDLRAAMRIWKAGTAANSDWNLMESYAYRTNDSEPWTHDIVLNDGRHATCNAEMISGNMTLVKFRPSSKRDAVVQKIQTIDPALHYADG